MNKPVDQNNMDIGTNNNICGYLVKRIVQLKEINSFYYELEHIKSGAKHIHISNKDAENTFSVAFKTVPNDSTGVAHILEHTVLCGSEKFPVHDPFFSMLKRSLSTFMNAFTSSDWTMYPFATQNKKDYYNLMDVYLDSVFFPNLAKQSFKQEGHRLEIENNQKDPSSSHLVYKGIVYNEMKGAMSSPSQVLIKSISNSLYPDTTYRFNAGGDPAQIPSLTYSQLKTFHKRHYHPSNAFFYTYGNIPLKKHLAFINNKILSKFSSIDPKTEVKSQPRWNTPRNFTYQYHLDKNEISKNKCQICLAWLTADTTDSFEVLSLSLLGQILLGNAASPLRKNLIDSKIGSNLSDVYGFDSDNKDTMFVCGLKDVEKSAAEKIETIIFDTLKKLANNEIDKDMIESAMHQLEFHRKEITNTPYPYGIQLVLSIVGILFHSGDPISVLQLDSDFEKLRQELSKGYFFENLIKKYFLNNAHRVLLTLEPDHLVEQKEDKRVKQELSLLQKHITPNELKKIIKETKKLRDQQETIEDISVLPTLELEDIPPLVQSVEESNAYPDIPAICYEQETSGISYLSTAIGIGNLPKEIVPLLTFFCYAMPRMGTKKHDYTEISQQIDRYTGGIGLFLQARTKFDGTGDCFPFITLNGKCLNRNIKPMFSIITEMLTQYDFNNLTRLKSICRAYRSGLESSIVQNGHMLAISLASRNFSVSCTLDEIWHGIQQLKYIKKLTDDLSNEKLKAISADLYSIASTLFDFRNFKMALIGEDKSLKTASKQVIGLQQNLEKKAAKYNQAKNFMLPEMDLNSDLPNEGWSTSSSVSFVATTFKAIRMEHVDAPAISVISKILKSMYLHREIREKGGAYGGFAVYNSEDGLFTLASYRDPHIAKTLQVFDNANTFITSGSYCEEDVKEAILQICSEIDKPSTPSFAARKAFNRKLVGLSDQVRKNFKAQLLNLNRKKIMSTAEKYFNKNEQNKAIAIISSKDKLIQANEKIKERKLTINRI